MSDRPHDQGGPDGQGPDQGGSSTPNQGSGDQPYSLSKGGDSAPDPSYGYGPPSYAGENPSGQPTYSDPSAAYGGYEQPAPSYDQQQPGHDQSAPSYDQSAYQQTSYDQQGSYAAPGASAPGAAGGYGAYSAPGAPGGYGTPPPKKKKTGLIVGLVALGAVVVLGVAIGLVAVLSGGGSKPSETVKAYLQALSDGNADKALEQGEKPSDATFATSAALKAQQDIAKISSIEVNDGYSSGNSARVTATYKFGDKQAGDQRFALTKIGGDWKLDDTTYPIDLTGLNDVPGLTLLGVDASGKDKAYVFPGPLVWGSSNKYLSVTESDSDDFTLSPTDGAFSYSTLETSLSDDGEKAVADAVTTYIDGCAKSKEVEPDNCPQAEYDYDAVAGSATWTAPDDLSGLEYRTSSPVTEVYVSGDLTWSVTYTAEDFDGKRTQVTADDVDGSLYGTVDLSKDPPVYSE